MLYPGLGRVAERFQIGTVIVHLGGVRFPWLTGPARYTMTAEDAVPLARQLQPEPIIPVHAEGWRHFAQSQKDAKEVLEHSAYGHAVHWPPAGEAITIDV